MTQRRRAQSLVRKTVVIGGGTGTYTVLMGLRRRVGELTAIINMVDDGGSTGVLRDELGALPPGDVRQSLVALSPESHLLRELMNYRFESGRLEGHPFGNLLLSALEKTTGSFAEAVQAASRILAIEGTVLPVTTRDTHLCLRRPDGSVIKSQQIIEDSFFPPGDSPDVFLDPSAELNPEAREAILEADLVIFGPGSFYTSLVPTLLVGGMPEALQQTSAYVIYVCNLVTKPGQTEGFKVHDFVQALEHYSGERVFDEVVYDTTKPSGRLLEKYRAAGEEWVEYDEAAFKKATYRATGADLIARRAPRPVKGDTLLARNFIRHDSEKLANLLIDLYQQRRFSD